MMSNLTFSRRHFMTCAGAAALTSVLPTTSFALNASEAEGLVNNAVRDINRVIASGASVNSMVNSFKGIFDRYADTAYLAAYALGNDGRSASNAQNNPLVMRLVCIWRTNTGVALMNLQVAKFRSKAPVP